MQAKVKITLKDGRRISDYGCGYCALQTLLKYYTPFAYSAGAYGWDCDYYDIDGVIICTGYRHISGKRIDYDMSQKYERLAANIIATSDNPQEECKKLINQFLEEIKGA